MKTSDKILLIFILLPTAFIMGNLISKTFNIKSIIEEIFNKPEVSMNSVHITAKTVSHLPVENKASTTVVKKIGENYTLGNMQYEVISAVNKGSTYSYNKTTGKYIILTIKATNVGRQEQGVSKIFIQDSKSRQYEMNSMLMDFSGTYSTYGSYKDYKGIPPGLFQTFTAPFEVAKDSSGLKLDFPSTQGQILISVDLGL